MVEHDGRLDIIDNSNHLEIDAIIAEVERIAREEPDQSIAIITPHTNQQKLLVDALSKHPDNEMFQQQQRLKIMTFDTCQGEERDIVLYSMVANRASDKLWGIFIKDLNSIDLEEGGAIKAQRLNVGLSRAKERIHFFLSKPIEEFTGSIGSALIHYQREIDQAKKLPDAGSTDARSPMESKVLQWVQESSFFKANKKTIELHTQFPLGEYIRQLDRRYKHPSYVVDFLLIYKDVELREHKIIIEYDGFEFHFDAHGSVNEFNYGEYQTEKDVYREKVLESYGYKFLRINRFNIGKDPIAALNARLEALVKKKLRTAA
jgi:very-short-patch-repair endonuclease